MAITVFYSWQSDSPKNTNRNFIEDAIERAIRKLNRNVELEAAIRDEGIVLDKDTKDVPGSPPIVDTILEKIAQSAVFVPDLTFVGRTPAGRLIPNPNVLIEYGWALRALGHARIVPVMNIVHGGLTAGDLPFNMRHVRHPITYSLAADDVAERRAEAKAEISTSLEKAIALVIGKSPVEGEEGAPYAGVASTANPSTFLSPGETFTSVGRFKTGSDTLYLPEVQRLFLRLLPHKPLSTIGTSKAAVDLIKSGGLRPMSDGDIDGWFHERNQHGAFACNDDNGKILHISQLFKTGEIWGIDCRTIDKESISQRAGVDFGLFLCELFEDVFVRTLDNYLLFARGTLDMPLPLKMIAGATGVQGYRMTAPRGMQLRFGRYVGNVVEDNIVHGHTIESYDTPAAELLMPFFRCVWEECGLVRPDKESLG